MLHSSSTQWKHRFTLEIYMEDGYVIVDGMPSSSRSYRDEWLIESRKGEGFAIGNPPEQSTFCNTDPSWELELAEFVDCIRDGRPVVNGTSARRLRDHAPGVRHLRGRRGLRPAKVHEPARRRPRGELTDDSTPIAVASRSFSRHPVLRAELLERYSDVRFNDEGVALGGDAFVAFARGRRKVITALERIDDDVLDAAAGAAR